MEQLAQFVSKTFEKRQIVSDVGSGIHEESLSKGKTSLGSMESAPHTKSPERVSPKSEAEKKENLQNVVDGLTNSQRRIMENIYQKLEIKKTVEVNATVVEDAKTFNGIDKPVKFTGVKSSVMDIANLIGEQNKSKKLDFHFPATDKIQLNVEKTEKALEPYPTEFSVQALKQPSRGSSVSPIIDPEDSRSSANSGSKRDLPDDIRSKIYIANEEDSKTGKFKSFSLNDSITQ